MPEYSTTASLDDGGPELNIKPLQDVVNDLKKALGGFGGKLGGKERLTDNKLLAGIKNSMDNLSNQITGSKDKSTQEQKKTNSMMSRVLGRAGGQQADMAKELAEKLPDFKKVDKRLLDIRNEVRELNVAWSYTDLDEETAVKKADEGMSNVAKKVSEGNDEVEKSDKKENLRMEGLKGKLTGGLMDLKGSLIPMIGIPLALGAMIGLMEKSSGILGSTFEVLQSSFMLMFKPFGDFIGAYFLPMAVSLIRFSSEWQIWAEEWKKQWAQASEDVAVGFEEGVEEVGPDAAEMERFNQALANFQTVIGESVESWFSFKNLGGALGNVWGGMQSVVVSSVNALSDFWHQLHLIHRGWETFVSDVNAAWAGAVEWVGKVKFIFTHLHGQIEDAWGSFIDWFSNLGLVDVFADVSNSVRNAIGTFKDMTVDLALNSLESAVTMLRDAFVGFYNWLAPMLGWDQIEIGKEQERQGPQLVKPKEPGLADSIVAGLESAWEGFTNLFTGNLIPEAYGDDGMLVYTEDGTIGVSNAHEIFPYTQNQSIPTSDPRVQSAISRLGAMFDALGIDIKLDTIDDSIRDVENAVGIIDVGGNVDWEFQFDRMVAALSDQQVEQLQETYTTEDIAQAVAQGLMDSAALERIVQVTQLNKQDILDRVFQIQAAQILSNFVSIPGNISIDTSEIMVNTGYDSIYTGAMLDKDGNPIGLNPDYQAMPQPGTTEEGVYMDQAGNILPPGEIGPYMQDQETGEMVVTPLQNRQIIDDTGEFDDLLTEVAEGLETELKEVKQSLDDFMMENDITINQMSFDDYMNATPEDMEKMGKEFRDQLGVIEAEFGKGSRQAWEFVSNWSEGWQNLNEVQVNEYNEMVEERNKLQAQADVLEGTVDEAGNTLVPGLNDLLDTAYAGREFESLGDLAAHATREGDHNIVRHIVDQLQSVGLVDEMKEVLADSKPESAVPEWMNVLSDAGIDYKSETDESAGKVYTELSMDDRRGYNESRALDQYYKNMADDIVGEQEFQTGMYDESVKGFEDGLGNILDNWQTTSETGLIYGLDPDEFNQMTYEDQNKHKEQYLKETQGFSYDEFQSDRRDVNTAGVGDYDTLAVNTLIDTANNIEGAIVSGLATPRSQEGKLSMSMMELMGLADISGSPRFPGSKVGADNQIIGEKGQVINRDYTIKEAYIDQGAFDFLDGIENAVFAGSLTVDQAVDEIIRFFQPVVKDNMSFKVGESRAYKMGGLESYITYQVDQAMRGEDARSYQLTDVVDLFSMAGINPANMLERTYDPSLGMPQIDQGYVLAPGDQLQLYQAEQAKAANIENVMGTLAPLLGITDIEDQRVDRLANIPAPIIEAIGAMKDLPQELMTHLSVFAHGGSSVEQIYSTIVSERQKDAQVSALISRFEGLMGQLEPGTSSELVDKWGGLFKERLDTGDLSGAHSALNQMARFVERLVRDQKAEKTQMTYESSLMDTIRDTVRPYTSQLENISAPIQDLINAMYETTMSADVSGYMDAFENLKVQVQQEVQLANIAEMDSAVNTFGDGVGEFGDGTNEFGLTANGVITGLDQFGIDVNNLGGGILIFDSSTGTFLGSVGDLNDGVGEFGDHTTEFQSGSNMFGDGTVIFDSSTGRFLSGVGIMDNSANLVNNSVGEFGSDVNNLGGGMLVFDNATGAFLGTVNDMNNGIGEFSGSANYLTDGIGIFGGHANNFAGGVGEYGGYTTLLYDSVDNFGNTTNGLNGGIGEFGSYTGDFLGGAGNFGAGVSLYDSSTGQLIGGVNSFAGGVGLFGNSVYSLNDSAGNVNQSANSINNSTVKFLNGANNLNYGFGTFTGSSGKFTGSVGHFGYVANIFGENVGQMANAISRSGQGAGAMASAAAVMAVSSSTNMAAARHMSAASDQMARAANTMMSASKSSGSTSSSSSIRNVPYTPSSSSSVRNVPYTRPGPTTTYSPSLRALFEPESARVINRVARRSTSI